MRLMPARRRPKSSVAGPIALTREQARHAQQLWDQFHALSSKQRDALVAQLQAESPGMWQQIHEARLAFEARNVITVTSTARPVKISELPAKLGWDPAGWQITLLKSLDEPGGANGAFKTPGSVTVSEMLTALRNPDNPTELSTASVNRLKAAIAKVAGGPAAEIAISAFDEQWKRDLFEAADQARNADRKISAAELARYFDEHPAAANRVTLQNLGVMLHQLASVTGEPDPFRLGGVGGAVTFVRTAYAGAFDPKKNVSTVVCQAITAQDLAERKAFARKDAFRRDDEMPASAQVTPGDFDRSGFDRGHLASNADAADAQNAFESFLMSNMAPQYPGLNRGAWRFLEDRVRKIVEATGTPAMMMVYTGTVFLDEDGRQLSDARLQRIGARRVAVPSHSFKSVLLRLPDGTQTTMSFMVRNVKNLPKTEQECAELLRSSRIDIDSLQKLTGVDDFFEGFIANAVEADMKKNKTAGVKPPVSADADLAEAFEYLFGPVEQSLTWKVPLSGYEVDMYLERVREVLAAVKDDKLAG